MCDVAFRGRNLFRSGGVMLCARFACAGAGAVLRVSRWSLDHVGRAHRELSRLRNLFVSSPKRETARPKQRLLVQVGTLGVLL